MPAARLALALGLGASLLAAAAPAPLLAQRERPAVAGAGYVPPEARPPVAGGRPGWSVELQRYLIRQSLAAGGPAAGIEASGGARAPDPVAPYRPVPAVDPDPPDQVVGSGELFSVLVMGTDRRKGEGTWRTDTLLLAVFDRGLGRVALLSIPRDLWVEIPGHAPGRINGADYLGSLAGLPDGALVRDTIELNLGLRVDHFVRLDLEGFTRVVDALGGLDLAVDCRLEDRFFDPEGLGGEAVVELSPGLHHLDGRQALRYARSRWGSSDFDRSRRQQRVVRAALAKARQAATLRRAPRLWRAVSPYLSTDLGAAEVARLALDAARLRGRLSVTSRVLQHPAVVDWTMPDGAQVLLADPAMLHATLAELLLEEESAPGPPPAAVTILDATGRPGWSQLIALRLAESGLAAPAIETVTAGPQSMVFYRPSAALEAQALAETLGLAPEALREAASWPGRPPASTPIWAHVGRDWRACRQ